jgi:hypothetical protein
MRVFRFLFAALCVFLLPAAAAAQGWAGIVAASRATDWSRAGVQGGIPDRQTVCATLNPGATIAQINSAISSCPANQVVKLNAGTYSVSGMILFSNKNNVTLRGAGANQTFLNFSSGGSCSGPSATVCVRGSSGVIDSPDNVVNWTAGYAKGATQITLSGTSNLRVGSLLILDQIDDASDSGGVWVCAQSGVCSDETDSGNGRGSGSSLRSQQQLVTVTAINGNTVTIDPPLAMPNWRADRSPQAFYPNSVVTGVGIEDLSLALPNSSGIIFMNAVNSWVKGVRSINPARSHVWLYSATRITVRDSYFYGTRSAASQSYGIEAFVASDILVENNIFQRITGPIEANGSTIGSVLGYNFSINDYYTASSGWMIGSVLLHSAGANMMLIEGNVGAGFGSDNTHGTHNFMTLFRNYMVGWESGKSQQTIPIHMYAGSRFYNVVGNVLGRSGYHSNYECAATSTTGSCGSGDESIYVLGFSDNGGSHGSYSNDLLTKTTLMRWGNYDVVNNAARFQAADVPSSLAQFANPVPASQALPASFYRSARPAWWGSMPWPAIGPDVTGGNIANVGGHAHMIPAQVCYSNVMNGPADGSGNVLNFDAASCYASSSVVRPQPPLNLTLTVN